MQRRLYRAFGIVLFALMCLFIQGCPTQNANTKTITVMVEPQADRTYRVTELDPNQDVQLDPTPFVATLNDTDTIKVTIPHVSVTAGASHSDAASEANYTIKDFQVEENTRDGWVRFSESVTDTDYATDIGVVILVDNSDSLQDQLYQNRELADQLGQELLRDERTDETMVVAVMPMTVEPGQIITFTNNLREATQQALRPRAHHYTPLYTAISAAMALFDTYQSPPRNRTDLYENEFQFEEKVIVVISDGQDNSSGTKLAEDIEASLREKGIHVFVLAVKGTDPIREDALRRLTGRTEATNTSSSDNRYIDLSRLSQNTALDRMTTVKNAIIGACHDRFNLHYYRSASIPEGPTEIRFILTVEPKE